MLDFKEHFDLNKIGISNHSRSMPEHPALVMGDNQVTYGELDKKTNAIANAILKRGVAPGERVSIMMRNCPEVLECCVALGKIGVTPILISYHFKDDEVAYLVNDSESKAIIYGDEFVELIERIKNRLVHILPGNFVCMGWKEGRESLSYEKVINCSLTTPPEIDTSSSFGMASFLIYTSGTTGKPKGVFKSAQNRLNTSLGSAYIYGLKRYDVHLVGGPLYHSAPYAWANYSLLMGNKVVLMARFDPEEWLRLVQEHRVSTAFIVPTMFRRILSLPFEKLKSYDVSTLRVLVSGGEAFPYQLKKEVEGFFGEGKLWEFYGSTETGLVCLMRPEDQLQKPESCGRKCPLVEDVKLLNDQREEVLKGEVGEIFVKGDLVLDGYHENKEATEKSFHGEYFTVGDMARVDDDGFYYIVDRKSDMVISGGVNIYPVEIEKVIYEHPSVSDVGVVGVKDLAWGEKLIAVVKLKEGMEATEEGIIEFVGKKLAPFKRPKEVHFVDVLPYSEAGKLVKRILREQYSQHGLER